MNTNDPIPYLTSKNTPQPSQLSQPCPQCGSSIGIIAGSKEAICDNCGFKDPCCE